MSFVDPDGRRIGWTQALCEPCFAAWQLGTGETPVEPLRLTDPDHFDPCLVCGTATGIYVRVDPRLSARFRYVKVESA